MCPSGNRTEIDQMIERPSSNGKVSGSIPGSVAFSHCWVKNYSDFHSSFPVTVLRPVLKHFFLEITLKHSLI